MTPPRLNTISRAVSDLAVQFQAAGIGSARLDARILVAEVAEFGASQLLNAGDQELSAAQIDQLTRLAERRVAHEPVSRIIGRREFWGLEFRLAPETLDPRPDTETVVQAVIDRRSRFDPRSDLRILDLGTGTGCLLLALLSEFNSASGVGVDIAAGAIDCALGNAARLGFDGRAQFLQSDWTHGVTGCFDIIVANPPYLDRRDMAELAPEVAYDPLRALDGGCDGLDAYRTIVPAVVLHLAASGLAAFEIGATQADAVRGICQRGGLAVEAVINDLGGHARCVVAGKA